MSFPQEQLPEAVILLARQPIFDQKQQIVAYELLFREERQDQSGEPNAAPAIFDGNAATSQVLLNAFAEAGGISRITGGKPAFVNFTKELLLSPPPFSSEHLVIEILETTVLTNSVINSIQQLHARGYQLALDDYVPDSEFDVLLPWISIVKLELPSIPSNRLAAINRRLRRFPIELLAEKVETAEMFRKCLDAGCTLFQGYFLAKPEIITGRKLPQSKLAALKLISVLQSTDLTVDQVVSHITHDPEMSYKILHLVNSAAYRRPKKLESIHMAVMLLGLSRIKSWATLLAMGAGDEKPRALNEIAMMRARLAETLGEVLEPGAGELYFTVGLLSTLDAYFDLPLVELVEQLPLSERVCDALLKAKGKPGLALHTALMLERGGYEGIYWKHLLKFGLTPSRINTLYFDAVEWVEGMKQ